MGNRNHIIDRADTFSGVNVDRKVIRNIKSREIIAEDIHYAAFSGWIDKKISSVIDNPVGVCYSMPGLRKVRISGEILPG